MTPQTAADPQAEADRAADLDRRIETATKAASDKVQCLVDVAEAAGEAAREALAATQAAADAVAEEAARGMWTPFDDADTVAVEAAAVYRAAVDAAARYVADCAYEAAGDEDAHECWQNATVPRYLTQEYKPAADVAHVAACRALAAVCRDPWPSASAIALERDLDEIAF